MATARSAEGAKPKAHHNDERVTNFTENVAKDTEADNMKSVLWRADRVMIKGEPQVG